MSGQRPGQKASPTPALTHDWIWQAIDALASRKKLSVSALARVAGLDATAFNLSKRVTPEGRPRWPSTESISKILDATGTTLDEFAEILNSSSVRLQDRHETPLDDIPIVGEIREPALIGSKASRSTGFLGVQQNISHLSRFALTIADSSLEPVYSQGNTLIVSPIEPLRAGDRVVVKPSGMQPIPRVLMRETNQKFEFAQFDQERQPMLLKRQAIDWIARIIWVRQ